MNSKKSFCACSKHNLQVLRDGIKELEGENTEVIENLMSFDHNTNIKDYFDYMTRQNDPLHVREKQYKKYLSSKFDKLEPYAPEMWQINAIIHDISDKTDQHQVSAEFMYKTFERVNDGFSNKLYTKEDFISSLNGTKFPDRDDLNPYQDVKFNPIVKDYKTLKSSNPDTEILYMQFPHTLDNGTYIENGFSYILIPESHVVTWNNKPDFTRNDFFETLDILKHNNYVSYDARNTLFLDMNYGNAYTNRVNPYRWVIFNTINCLIGPKAMDGDETGDDIRDKSQRFVSFGTIGGQGTDLEDFTDERVRNLWFSADPKIGDSTGLEYMYKGSDKNRLDPPLTDNRLTLSPIAQRLKKQKYYVIATLWTDRDTDDTFLPSYVSQQYYGADFLKLTDYDFYMKYINENLYDLISNENGDIVQYTKDYFGFTDNVLSDNSHNVGQMNLHYNLLKENTTFDVSAYVSDPLTYTVDEDTFVFWPGINYSGDKIDLLGSPNISYKNKDGTIQNCVGTKLTSTKCILKYNFAAVKVTNNEDIPYEVENVFTKDDWNSRPIRFTRDPKFDIWLGCFKDAEGYGHSPLFYADDADGSIAYASIHGENLTNSAFFGQLLETYTPYSFFDTTYGLDNSIIGASNTILHEFGHNLGLTHPFNESDTYCPFNIPDVMPQMDPARQRLGDIYSISNGNLWNTPESVARSRIDNQQLFYTGYNNYMGYAFPDVMHFTKDQVFYSRTMLAQFANKNSENLMVKVLGPVEVNEYTDEVGVYDVINKSKFYNDDSENITDLLKIDKEHQKITTKSLETQRLHVTENIKSNLIDSVLTRSEKSEAKQSFAHFSRSTYTTAEREIRAPYMVYTESHGYKTNTTEVNAVDINSETITNTKTSNLGTTGKNVPIPSYSNLYEKIQDEQLTEGLTLESGVLKEYPIIIDDAEVGKVELINYMKPLEGSTPTALPGTYTKIDEKTIKIQAKVSEGDQIYIVRHRFNADNLPDVPLTLSFNYKASTEAGWDFLRFYVRNTADEDSFDFITLFNEPQGNFTGYAQFSGTEEGIANVPFTKGQYVDVVFWKDIFAKENEDSVTFSIESIGEFVEGFDVNVLNTLNVTKEVNAKTIRLAEDVVIGEKSVTDTITSVEGIFAKAEAATPPELLNKTYVVSLVHVNKFLHISDTCLGQNYRVEFRDNKQVAIYDVSSRPSADPGTNYDSISGLYNDFTFDENTRTVTVQTSYSNPAYNDFTADYLAIIEDEPYNLSFTFSRDYSEIIEFSCDNQKITEFVDPFVNISNYFVAQVEEAEFQSRDDVTEQFFRDLPIWNNLSEEFITRNEDPETKVAIGYPNQHGDAKANIYKFLAEDVKKYKFADSTTNSDDTDWKTRIAIILAAYSAKMIRACFPSYGLFFEAIPMRVAESLIRNEIILGVKDQSGVVGKLLTLPKTINSTDVYSVDMPLYDMEHLTGSSEPIYEPQQKEYLGKKIEQYEEGDGYIKHIYPRGVDVIQYIHRIELDPVVERYCVGRTKMYCRYNETLLNDSYFYPMGPAFRINTSQTVTHIVFNGDLVPHYLITRESWDKNGNDKLAVTFNFAAAGIVPKYTDDGITEYNESNLNEVEIWYKGEIQTAGNGYIHNVKTGISNDVEYFDTDLQTIAKEFDKKYFMPPEDFVYTYIDNGEKSDSSKRANHILRSSFALPHIDFFPSDFKTEDVYTIFPHTMAIYDKAYQQIEFIVPNQFFAHSGGTRRALLPIIGKEKSLFVYTPGYKASGPDYRSQITTSHAFHVSTFDKVTETVNSSITGRAIAVEYEMEPRIYSWFKNTIVGKQMENMIHALETLYGEYPYDTIKWAWSNRTNIAMEFMERPTQSFTWMSIYVFIHELSHMWNQNKISYISWDHQWTDEGAANLLEHLVQDMIIPDKSESYLLYYEALITLSALLTGDSGAIKDDYDRYDYSKSGLFWTILLYFWGADKKSDGSGKPVGPLEQYYNGKNVNVHFWAAMKNFLNAFSDKLYSYEEMKEVWGTYVEQNATTWNNKWPSTRDELYHYFDTFLAMGGKKQLEQLEDYKLTLLKKVKEDPALVKSAWLTNVIQYFEFNVYYIGSEIIVNDAPLPYEFSVLRTPSLKYFDVTAELTVLVDDNDNFLLGGELSDFYVDGDVNGTSKVEGKIVLISRGSYYFVNKSQNAEAAGAAGCIIFNNVPGGAPFDMGVGPDFTTTIPTVMIGNIEGLALADQLINGEVVTWQMIGNFPVLEMGDTSTVMLPPVYSPNP